MSNIKRIFIIGHSGAGKGVLAQEVAKKLGWNLSMQTFLGVLLTLDALYLKLWAQKASELLIVA